MHCCCACALLSCSANERDYVIYGKRSQDYFNPRESILATAGYRYDPDEPESKDMLVVTLKETDDYILLHSIENNSIMFYRAVYTKVLDIKLPIT